MMNIDKTALANKLIEARDTATPLPEEYRQPEFTLEEAYAVQEAMREEKERRGIRVIGKKVGFTSRGMRERFHFSEPDYGSIFNTDIHAQGAAFNTSKYLTPKVEGEIAFILKKDLKGPGLTVADVIDATKGVMACLEFVDSRWAFDIDVLHSIADNGSCGGFMLGSKLVPLEEVDLRYIAMFMMKNGVLVSSGAGVEVMGDPLNSVVWLANKMSEHGTYLRAGDIILSGAITAAEGVEKGDVMSVNFSQLGSINIHFV